VTGIRYRLEVRLTRADVGKRVVIRWRPGPADSKQATDVLGILEQADAGSFAVRTRDGKLVVIPAGRAVAGKVVTTARPPAPPQPQASLTGAAADPAVRAAVMPHRRARAGQARRPPLTSHLTPPQPQAPHLPR